jgi:hypothetical protein
MGIRAVEGLTDLATTHPAIAAQWHPTLNDHLKPTNITAGSGKQCWWVCDKGHSYQDSPKHKKEGRGCTVCSNRKIISGVNDLEFLQPSLAAQWHPIKNGSLLPSAVSIGSKRKAWWICERGHEWESIIASRMRSAGCPICSNKKLVQGQNDLYTTHPSIGCQWHESRNFPIKPQEVFAGTASKYWWQCSKGHEWRASGVDRVAGKGCPICSGQKLAIGINDFESTHPEIAKQWHPLKNGRDAPRDFVSGGRKKFWWRCLNNHEWESSISGRKSGRGCPKCPVDYVYKGSNLLLEVNPSLASQWHPTLNQTPLDSVAAGSHLKAWWMCEQKHQWQATVGSRQSGRNCPYCSLSKVLPGLNDLATASAELAKQWNKAKNGVLLPSHVSLGSNKQVWWTCDKGHEWKASPHNRSKGQGCAVCANRQLAVGINDLATTHPDLAKQWHPVRNLPLLPTDVITGTSRKFWWVCDKGHEWQATGNSRFGGRGCPACSPTGFDSTRPAILYFIQNEKLLARKVGITNTQARTDRLLGFEKLGWTVVKTYESNPGLLVQTVEQVFFQWLRKDLGLPAYLGSEEMGVMGGWSETFSLDGLSNDAVIAQIEAIMAKASATTVASQGQ